MTFEPEPRPAGPRPVLQRRRPGALIPTVVVIGTLIVAVLIASQVWTEVLWYRQLGYSQVYRTELLARAGLFVLGAGVMAAAVASSLVVGYRSRPIYAPMSTEQQGLDRYRDSVEPLRRLIGVAVPVTFGLFAGSAASQQWATALLWWNRVPFGTKDPQFDRDIGFFVFTLPWLQFLRGYIMAAVVLAGLTALVTHYLYGGLRMQGGGPRFTAAARLHLGILAAAFLLLHGVGYWLGRYALSTRDSGRITGLTYTDANAVLTARGVLAAIAVIVAGLFVVAAVLERWRMIPLYGVALLVVISIFVGQLYPAAVQRFQVKPSEQVKEAPYIDRNIVATRAAYGLANIEVQPYTARTEAQPNALRDDAETIPGIRLLDPAVVSPAFRQLEQNKQYYSFPDSLDVDRYQIDGELRDTVIAVRELDISGAPEGQRNWVNDHVVFTHGFGVVAAYRNQRQPDGKPAFFQKGIPSNGELGEYEPRIYFGEKSPEYSIVGGQTAAGPRELDFPDDTVPSGGRNTTYTGSGGVPIGSALNQLLYAIKFGEQNILLSGDVNPGSRIMYDRHPRQRVQKVAPFLTLDGDPYPAVVDGRVVWIVDGYTTTNRYPYSRTQILRDATSDSITESRTSVIAQQRQRINYIRNSVKAVVDAYDGRVDLYAWDQSDPILQAWSRVFPGVIKPMASISGDLMSHLRYPEDLFKLQRDIMQRYHVTEAGAFFTTQDFWQVPTDPTNKDSQLQPPYYLTLQMPGQDDTSFSLTSTFIPASGGTGGTRNVLTGFLAVDADAGADAGQRRDGYGQLRLLQLPRDSVVPGPGQVQNNFNANPTVSTQLNLLRTSTGGSTVTNGNLLTLPVGGGLLYVQPVYVAGSGATSYPLLQKVLVAFGDSIGFADTLDEALNQVFQGDSGAPSTGVDPGTNPPEAEEPGGPATDPVVAAQARLRAALEAARDALADSQKALADQDFAAYGEAQDRLKTAVERAIRAQADLAAAQGEPAAAGGATPTPTPTPSP